MSENTYKPHEQDNKQILLDVVQHWEPSATLCHCNQHLTRGSIKRDTHGSVLDETTATAVYLSILRGRNSNNRCCESDEGEKGLESHDWRVSG